MRRPGVRAVRALRALAAWIALVLVGAQLSSIGHHVLVAHYLCSEHGTLHHGDAPEARAVDRVDVETAAAESEGDHGTHDDCAAPVRTPPDAIAADAPAVQLTQSAAAGDRTAGDRGRGHASIPLLALAPKQGPPRA